MSEFIQVGLSAMRDPVTGQLLPAVPIYVEVVNGEMPPLPVIDREAFAREIIRKVGDAKAAARAKKGGEKDGEHHPEPEDVQMPGVREADRVCRDIEGKADAGGRVSGEVCSGRKRKKQVCAG